MSAILLATDLMTASKAQAAAARAGCPLKTAASDAALLTLAAEDGVSLVILDLSTAGVDPATLVPRLRLLAGRPAILAFGPHVHEARLQAAAEAGCDRVISRGQFHAQAEEILAVHAAGAP
jgi:DNA-binding NarL/FixJ family response regulator